jgi:tetratricopeptide (TPR) repeat protein
MQTFYSRARFYVSIPYLMWRFSMFFFHILISLSMSAQVPDAHSARTLIYQSYVAGNIASWQRGVERLKVWCEQHPEDLDWQLEWAQAEYGLVGSRLAAGGEGLSDSVKQLQARVEALLKRRPDWAGAHALLGALYGMRVHLSPSTTLYFGPKSVNHIDRAIELDPRCAGAWMEKGNTKYHAPAIFGGNKAKAVECYSQAVSLYRADAVNGAKNWMYLYALAWLGLAQEANGDFEAALGSYRDALRVAPGFNWIKSDLLPSLEVRMRQN